MHNFCPNHPEFAVVGVVKLSLLSIFFLGDHNLHGHIYDGFDWHRDNLLGHRFKRLHEDGYELLPL